jgi:hypothetical protein
MKVRVIDTEGEFCQAWRTTGRPDDRGLGNETIPCLKPATKLILKVSFFGGAKENAFPVCDEHLEEVLSHMQVGPRGRPLKITHEGRVTP